MIVSHVIGGLGNQMFQYALGKSRSLDLATELRIHAADFSEYTLHHGYELDRVFHTSVNTISGDEFSSFLGWRSNRYLRKALRYHYFSVLRGAQFVVEPTLQYWSGISNVRDNSYLMGYWQSEKYFSNIEEAIRSDFAFKLELNAKNMEMATKISQCNAVSLHVRRGDYLINPKTNATHGLCSIDYYKAAIAYVSERIQYPEFFIFSDDIAWVRKSLDVGFPSNYIDHNKGQESYNDMRLMSLCQHHIIANSSFSWWGAWLNPKIDKIVIAPKRWFASAHQTDDLLPQNWTKL